MGSSELGILPGAARAEDSPEWSRADEPNFPSREHQLQYRGLVTKMEAESNLNPATKTVTSLMIRKCARDYVVGLIADQDGSPKARQAERDRRLMKMMTEIRDAGLKTNAGSVDPVRFAVALVEEIMGVLESDLGHEQVLASKVKEHVGAVVVSFTKAYAGRLKG